jgi:hypothetical protein
MKRIGSLALLGIVALPLGCAQERPAINRVQAFALQKSFFVGQKLEDPSDDPEFYMRGTVVDVGYGAGSDGLFTSTYAQPISRVKWEITESLLNARLAYERIAGSDGKGLPYNGLTKKPSNDGQIVASYKISSHFDIQRAYNPTTGEPLNVLEENTTDRPWFQREYFRVDWSQNLATDVFDFDTLSMMGLFGSIQYEPIPYVITDANHPDAPRFDMDSKYFDITTKAFARPQQIDLSSLGWGINSFPACYLPGEFAGGTAPYGNCNPIELTLRYSFKKVVDTDYEPADYDGYRFQANGAFTNDYYGYDRNYGMVDEKWFRFASRYNIWDRSHYYADPANMTGEVKCATTATTDVPPQDGLPASPDNDPNRDVNPANGTADECEAVTQATGVGGSRCDVFKQKCTLPFQLRQSKTIPWYINDITGNEDLFEATNWAVQEWNLAMQSAVQIARLVECRKTGGGDCDTKYPMWSGQQDDFDDAVSIARTLDVCQRTNKWVAGSCDSTIDNAISALGGERGNLAGNDLTAMASVLKIQPVIVLCHNPVNDQDHPACGKTGTAPRLGDLRYHTVLVIDKPQQPSAWGIMVDADDPISGEKVAASINIWAYVTDVASQNLVDLVRYINGEIPTEDVTNGTYVHNWVQAQKIAASGGMPTMETSEVTRRLSGATSLTAQAFAAATATPVSDDLRANILQMQAKIRDIAASTTVPSPNQAMVDARMNLARGTPTEAKLINPAMLQLAGIPGSMPVAGAVTKLASPFGGNNLKMASQLRQLRQNALAKRGACILDEAPEASSLTGIADIMKKKFPMADGETPDQQIARHQAMFRYIRRRYHYAVLAHEMGHSVGLRHNFVSSYGALFFRPQYWQLRTKNGRVTTECTGPVADGSTCVGPRYYDPVTDEEQSQLIWQFMQSSVMDYPGDVSQDMIGLGVWDVATARMLYGDNVAMYTSPNFKAGTRNGIGITSATDTFGGLSGIQYSYKSGRNATTFHYSQLQKQYGLISNCYPVTPQQPSWWRTDVDGVWDPVMDGHVVTVDSQFSKCRQLSVDYMGWTQLDTPHDNETDGQYRGGPNVDRATLRLRVPYHFASDNWADLGNVSVFRHDNGADPYEQAMFLITTQENRHIFDNFRRNRSNFNVRSAADRSFSRYNEKLVNIAGGMSFYSNIFRNLAQGSGYTFDTLWPQIVNEFSVKEQVLAATIAFDHLTRELSRPEPGGHYQMPAGYEDPTLRSSSDADGFGNAGDIVTIPNGATGFLRDVGFGGHPLENALSSNHGDYDVDYTVNAGSYYDKIHAILHMSISEDRFISQSRGDFYDARFRANGFADLFPEGWRRVIANALTGDRSVLASWVSANPDGTPELAQDGSGFPKRPLGWTSWWPNEGPTICFPSNGRNACSMIDGVAVNLSPDMPANIAPVDPQVGWEVQKFVIAYALSYITANQHTNWLDMMRIYKLGQNADPQFADRIEWQDPVSEQVYYARTFGKECLLGTGSACTGGKIVQRGIAARVLEWANYLTSKGYKVDTTHFPAKANQPAGYNDFGRVMVVRQPDGRPVVASDPNLVSADTNVAPPDCDQNINPNCTPLNMGDNHWAVMLDGYKSVPDYLWEVLWRFQLGDPNTLGEFP